MNKLSEKNRSLPVMYNDLAKRKQEWLLRLNLRILIVNGLGNFRKVLIKNIFIVDTLVVAIN